MRSVSINGLLLVDSHGSGVFSKQTNVVLNLHNLGWV